ncbi:MAG: enoyl-CoA hydratase/isomerase family protein, partial [Arenicellales bacterium]
MTERIIVRRDGHVAWLIFNRPDRLNAMTIEAWALMDRRLAELNDDRDIRCLVIAGEGRSFLAGHDVAEIRQHNEDIESGQLVPSQLREWQKHLQNSTRLIRAARFPVIAAVQGYAVGAGCELVFACDLVVAARDARFGFPEVNIGVTITNGGTYFMPRKVGLARARELAYTGEF